VVRGFNERRVDGIIVTASRVGAVYLPMLSEIRAPIVLVNNQHPTEFVYSVTIANFEAARDMTRHLIQLGHQRIGYIGDRFGNQSDTERFGGYRAALNEVDLPFEPDLVVHGNGRPEGGMAGIQRLLALETPPTAVFCYNDMTAIGALRAIHGQHWRVPRDISIAGFDDLYLAQYTDPPLTTVRQPMREMGRIAMNTLFTLMAGSAPPQTTTKLPGELIVRESTGPNTKESMECSCSYSQSAVATR
jgi:DNA-binding LacI/PurR family transcriptional regulator